MFNENNWLQGIWFRENEIVAKNPATMHDRNKRIVRGLVYPEGVSLDNTLSKYVRWEEAKLPDLDEIFPADDWVDLKPGYYDYQLLYDGWPEWHVNFADRNLFAFYASGLMAQDETMVAEHPVLANLREHLLASGYPALTQGDCGPTPITITNVTRRCSVDVSSLYGHRFRMAEPSVVRSAVKLIDPPTKTNVIAMASLCGGDGSYTAEQIEYLLAEAYTGFAAARSHSESPCVIHTGFWGCGAFGGNRTLMTLIQIVAASMAHIQRLAVHYGDESGLTPVEDAVDRFEALRWMTANEVIERLESMGFCWGEGDGN